MIDVIERLQKAETRPLDADGKTQLWETLQDARAEIARLRLTDAEREAVEWILANARLAAGVDRAATLRGLLERLANEVGGRLVPLLATDFAAQAPDFASQPPDIAGSVTIRQPVTLTDAERKAVEWFSRFATPQNGPVIGRHAAALRGLLERLSRPDKSYPKRCVL